jgi:UDP-N-acetylmuramoylalanine--D-glutamate ligase
MEVESRNSSKSGRMDAAPGGAAGAGPRIGHVVVGLGRTGVSCVRHLRAQGIAVTAMDSRKAPPGLEAIRAEGDDVLSPGVALAEPAIDAAVRAGVAVVGDIELFAEVVKAPVVAVTGSNGKSTVTSMIGAMAERAGHVVRIGGNIGTPALDLLDPGTTLYVLELSSFQLETTSHLDAEAAAVLNLTPDHGDRYRSAEAYVAAKRRILDHAAVAVLNRDDPTTAAMARGGQRVVGFTLAEPGEDEVGLRQHGGRPWLAHGPVSLMPAADVGAPGRHNIANALAALALGTAIGLERAPMLDALRAFRGLPHRCERIASALGVGWINDSKGTNVGATVAALGGFGAETPVVLIAGGDGKGADFAPLRAAVARHARAVVLIGRDGQRIAEAIEGAAPVEFARDLDDAVARARTRARRGDTVLFSPACASFDMFTDYEARGEAFVRAVRQALGR